MTFNTKTGALFLLLAAMLSSGAFSIARAAENERDLIAVLQGNSPPAEKAITCKKLAIYGSKEAVPALAALLLDPELTSWVRTALEAIPDPAAAAALRDALPKAEGRVLIGIINSVGVKRDSQAVSALVDKLHGSDPDVAAAAATSGSDP
jgi:HEAT repeat protein